MNGFYEYLYKYGLHDCTMNCVEIKNNMLVCHFEQGVYYLNDFGKEMSNTSKCAMIINLDEKSKFEEQINVLKVYRNKRSDVKFEKFVEETAKSGFEIMVNYYSYFCNTIMLKGFIRNHEYEISISTVKKISFCF